MTYNYILNPYVRDELDIFEENSIVILDEAHNICNNLEDFNSRIINIYVLNHIKISNDLIK